MFKVTKISNKVSGSLNNLVEDYLNKKESTFNLFEHYPDLEGFQQIIKNNLYQNFNRSELYNIVLKQNNLSKNVTTSTIQNIELLKFKNTYTITTGHQLCLFTGPLYFLYKIITTVNLAEELKIKFPENNFVPVYWMAGEDHDFEEINHFHVFGKKIEWLSEQKGAVGEFKTESLLKTFEEIKIVLGTGENALALIELFESAYLKHSNLKDATRYLVNHLFASYGLVTVDGNDIDFKKQFTGFFEKDIFENESFKSLDKTIQYLTDCSYPIQVNPRPINCFYLGENARNRIEEKEGQYHLIGTDTQFSASELKELIIKHPEKISPNVVLRPLYQQHILPNIAYVGGPGELAYWLEYKEMFKNFNLQFPILMPRNFITVIDAPLRNKIEKLLFKSEDFFKPEPEIIENFQIKNNAVFELEEKEKLNLIYSEISNKVGLIDKSLIGNVQAELQKSLNGLNLLENKVNKAFKQKSETEINQIKNIKQKMFPSNVPQERFENFSTYYLKFGFTFIDAVKDSIEPFDFSHKILTEVF
jgi:bacillithiol biosynthesis cysteine-adding enzyme BshC